MAYLRQMRVERMARLLVTTDLSVAEVARSVGWRNQFHASQCFHAAHGVSPTDYRRRLRRWWAGDPPVISTPVDAIAAAGGLSLPDAAAAYARAGLAVFACVPGEKRPLTPHGLSDATADPARVAGWWRRWPEANIGLATGLPGGFDVLDIDVHPGGSGFPALRRARQAGLVDGWAVLVRSPSGGVHLYLPVDPEREQRSWALPKAHVDFRGAGGYVIAPPSRITDGHGHGRRYRLIATNRDPLPVQTGKLRRLLDPPRPRTEPTPSFGLLLDPDTQQQALTWADPQRRRASVPLEPSCIMSRVRVRRVEWAERTSMRTATCWSKVTRCRYVCAAHRPGSRRDDPRRHRIAGSARSRFGDCEPGGHLHPRGGRGDRGRAGGHCGRDQLQPYAGACRRARGDGVAGARVPAVGGRHRDRGVAGAAGRPALRAPVRLAAMGRAGGRDDGEPGRERRGGRGPVGRPGDRGLASVRAPGGGQAAVRDAGTSPRRRSSCWYRGSSRPHSGSFPGPARWRGRSRHAARHGTQPGRPCRTWHHRDGRDPCGPGSRTREQADQPSRDGDDA